MDEDLSLAGRVVDAPCLANAEETHARVESWLVEIAGTSTGKALKQLLADHPQAGALVAGVAEASPHLWEMMRADPARLVVLFESNPDTRIDTILREAARAIAASVDEAE